MSRIYGHAYALLSSIREHERIAEKTGKDVRKVVRVEVDPNDGTPPDPHVLEAIQAGCVEAEPMPSKRGDTDLAYARLTEAGQAELEKGHPGLDGREVER